MPELPEVETTCSGIRPHINKQIITKIIIRQSKLRWPIPARIKKDLENQTITSVERRAKYILINTDVGTLIIHLGMSGSLRILDKDAKIEKHDHFDLVFASGQCLRLRDPRRFGAVLFTKKDPLQHKLISHLGPEPLHNAFDLDYLFQKSRKRNVTIKQFIMDGKIVVGVGNIYASEALFRAGINPRKAAGKVTKKKYELLVTYIKEILSAAIKAGGTTLRDFSQSDGKPGYFQQVLIVYGREGEACPNCKAIIKKVVIGQRASFYCPKCQRA